MSDPRATLYCGDALAVLETLPAESVQTCVTSPPYWRQRDYGKPGQIGLELTPEIYVEDLLLVFQEVRRVLRDDGTLWLNIGDKWASGGHGGGGSFMAERGDAWQHAKGAKGWRSPPAGYKDKDLVGIPWMTAFALRGDGWFLRQCNIWAKPNTMPESVRDRSTVSHEYVFQFSKRGDYYYDSEAARTPMEPSSETRLALDCRPGERETGQGQAPGPVRRARGKALTSPRHDGNTWNANNGRGFIPVQDGANLRSVWWIAPAQYRDAHFAVMPEKLATICIAAGSRPGDCVLDPFGGSGTVASVATGMGRSSIYIDLNPAYLELAKQRIGPMLCDTAAA